MKIDELIQVDDRKDDPTADGGDPYQDPRPSAMLAYVVDAENFHILATKGGFLNYAAGEYGYLINPTTLENEHPVCLPPKWDQDPGFYYFWDFTISGGRAASWAYEEEAEEHTAVAGKFRDATIHDFRDMDVSLPLGIVTATPAFYINPKVIDPEVGSLAAGIDEALTWSRDGKHSHTLPVYTVPPQPPAWNPIGTAPTDNKRRLYLARMVNGRLLELDFDGTYEYWQESHEMPDVYGWHWCSANGIEEPTHWAYQDEPLPVAPSPDAEPTDSELLDFIARDECQVVEYENKLGPSKWRVHWPHLGEGQKELYGTAREALVQAYKDFRNKE